jgi:ABC-type multidrug transport system fused ATPase/permease subunit
LYDADGGVVRIDGLDIGLYNLAQMHAQMASVTQEPPLFAVSIAENIAYGQDSVLKFCFCVVSLSLLSPFHQF